MKVKRAIEAIPPELKLKDVPDMVRAELSALDGEDLAKGLLGFYMKQHIPKNMDFSPGGMKYRPNPGSEYSIDYKPGDIKLGAKWKF